MSLPRDHAGILKLIIKHGWRKERDGSDHWRLIGPEGQEVRASNTPRDKYFAGVKLRNDLIKAGFRLRERKPYTPPPSPKLVVDRSVMAEAPKTPEAGVIPPVGGKLPRGAIRDIVANALHKLGSAPAGRSPADLLDRVRINIPKATELQIAHTLAALVPRGRVLRVAPGRFNPPDGPIVIPERKKRTPKAKVSGDDMAVLEQALAAMAALEQVIKKYQGIASKLEEMQRALGGLK